MLPLPLPADLLDVNAVARMFAVHVSAVYRWIHAHKLPAYRIGSRWKVSRAEAVAFVEHTGTAAKGEAAARPMTHQEAMRLLRDAGVVKG